MKKITFCILSVFFMLTFIPSPLRADNDKNTVTAVSPKSMEAVTTNSATDENAATALINADNAKAEEQLARLEEIRAMDKSELTAAEKKELRDEVHSIQRDMDRHDRDRDRHDNDGYRHHGGGLYFTFGGGLLVILILILLL